MAVRSPRGEDALNALEAELFSEKLESLGRSGRKAQALLERLAAFDGPPGSEAHEVLLDATAAAVWGFMVQRELCGLAAADVLGDLAVPPSVAARLGAARPKGKGG